MSRVKTLQALFKRYRRPGDIVFAWVFLAFALFLLFHLTSQTQFKPGGKFFAQPRFWPAVALFGMAVFAALHLIGSALSERIEGRWQEVWLWIRSVEYAGWFIAYAAVVPIIGYLPATVLAALLLTVRAGYGNRMILTAAFVSAIAIVVLFKSFLQVKLPAGQVYEYLPDGLRQIMLTYF